MEGLSYHYPNIHPAYENDANQSMEEAAMNGRGKELFPLVNIHVVYQLTLLGKKEAIHH